MKTIKEMNLSRLINSIMGTKQNPVKIVPLRLYRLNKYTLPELGVDVYLKEYFIDEEGSLYSRNTNTYFTKYGKLLTKLSDNTMLHGKIINTLRDISGKKVTIQRNRLINMMNMGKLEEVTLQQLTNENDSKVDNIKVG